MKRAISIFILIQISVIQYCQIIADHTVVDKYDDIPAVYMAEIKKMWLSYSGESHSVGVRNGLASLEALYPSYAVDITTVPPRPYTEVNLRANGTTWGDVSNETGWISNSGEEDWFTSALAVTRKKAGLTYCATTGPALNAFGFGWCWDPAIINATEYLDATQQYIDYCAANSISTKVFFTTGPVDGSCATGELGYNKNLMYEAIRTYAKANSSRILFDYADILCYDDGDQTPNTTTWNGHVYPVITETNLNPVYSGHISQSGGIRIAKALWWMLARMAGWDGSNPTGINEPEKGEAPQVIVERSPNEIRLKIGSPDLFKSVNLYNYLGRLISDKQVDSDMIVFNISSLERGIYFIVLSNGRKRHVEKVAIL